MKKLTLLLMMTLLGLNGYAQSNTSIVKFGYLSIDSVMQGMPEYAQMQYDMKQLAGHYEAEQKRVEDDFNKKYEDFLDGQSSYPKTILQKRQNELQEMLDKNIAFKKESQILLNNARTTMTEKIQSIIASVLKTIGQERGYAFIINTDKESVPFINPALGEDITSDVKALLNSK